ncbi:MAG: chemotaxis protein [Rhodobacteraceae bacterium]|nr:MAG: chemotaxis protein [Paracoccaceae bacterium]
MVVSDVFLTDQQFSFLSEIVHKNSGIVITEAKRGLLTARLNRRLRHLGLSSYDEYCSFLRQPGGESERQEIISSITTNVTAFFREVHHFEALRSKVLPPLLEAARRGERVRVWSCACSTGEEVYSIALSVFNLEREVAKMDFLILGTDIDPLVVAKAQAGVFDQDAERQIPREFCSFFARGSNRTVCISDSVKSIVRFATLNLHGDWPFSGRFDIIFCRNVVIYFDSEGRKRLWGRLGERLNRGGSLFIGHSERLDGEAASGFKLAGATHYVKS